MAVGLQTGVPWVMCKQDDAPDPVVTISSSLSLRTSNSILTEHPQEILHMPILVSL